MEPRDGEGRVPGDSEALAQDLAALATLPRLSLLDGHAAIQRSQDAEIGYEKKIRATTLNLSAYHERVTNDAMTMVAPEWYLRGRRSAARHFVAEQRFRRRQLSSSRVCGFGVASAGRSCADWLVVWERRRFGAGR